MDPDPDQIEAAREVGANAIELHTGDFATAGTHAAQQAEAERLARGAEKAHEMGLRVHAGHGPDYLNYSLFAQAVPHVREVSIGFAVVARAVREMRLLVKGY